MQAYFLLFLTSLILLARKDLRYAFIAVGVCEVMKVLFQLGIGMKR
ncbi:hypothetical protein IQ31_04069 [Sphingobacterium siyangense]|jgi:hypothetical protein|uniref:Uncharacterized protein n=1 Tax=Sphingobacterium siyangense TaxID=459529 RepID=A0A562MBF8_9SPHI|nr:hypothetical protein IQ31_04069 [Sphingobacterium siyangense]